MAPYESLYGRKCRSPVSCFESSKVRPSGKDLVHDFLDRVRVIKERLRVSLIRQKAYADRRLSSLRFGVGNSVFLRVLLIKGIMTFGRKGWMQCLGSSLALCSNDGMRVKLGIYEIVIVDTLLYALNRLFILYDDYGML
ncbi:uncharacterized protein LOC107853752 [Capsicum annuum]|uniref:uncharacterized protein LOC107853752 n=1 Tax=Capsicum annuum TaxID=4072 RepID=UPI0007BFDD7F|nr:uncharacterized protein LOC107853752 [Capsicum annuum]